MKLWFSFSSGSAHQEVKMEAYRSNHCIPDKLFLIKAIGGADFPDCDSLTETGFLFLSFLFKCFTHVRLPPQVEDDENVTAVPNSKNSCKGEDISINLQPASAYEFGQSLNAARSSGNTVACAELLASTAPEMLPQFLSTQLDGHTISFIMQALHSHLLEKDPYLVYQHLNHLHTADRFSVRLACKYGLKS